MKFSVDVEIDMQVYLDGDMGRDTPSRKLNWDIKVLDVKSVGGDKTSRLTTMENGHGPVNGETVTRASDFQEDRRAGSQSPSGEDREPKRAKVGEDGVAKVRRISKMEQDDLIISRAMSRKTSRKVSREGEWLIFVDKTGVLTTQNGTQQIKETRVKFGTPEFAALLE